MPPASPVRLAAFAFLAAALPAQQKLAELRARATELLAAHWDGHAGIGVVVAVRTDGVEVTLGFGEIRPGGPPPDRDTVYEIGSVTKAFTGILLADLAGAGKLALGDPLAAHLPDGIEPPAGGVVRLVDLATHSSGLPRMPGNFAPADGGDPYADYDDARLFAFVAECDLRREPGKAYEYSNLGMGLLGTLLAREQGTDYESLLRARVLAPLGLRDTTITLDQDQHRRLIPGHDRAWRPARNWGFRALAGAGALRSTAHDMLRFGTICLAPGEAPPGPAILESQRVHFAGAGGAVGLGWHVSAHEAGAGTVVWHNGRTGGYGAFLGVDKKAGNVVVILVNDVADVDRAGFGLLEFLRR